MKEKTKKEVSCGDKDPAKTTREVKGAKLCSCFGQESQLLETLRPNWSAWDLDIEGFEPTQRG